jgi:hypothetical protein
MPIFTLDAIFRLVEPHQVDRYQLITLVIGVLADTPRTNAMQIVHGLMDVE